MGTWVRIKEAALRLELSEDTIRRHIKAGTMPARRDPLPQGGFRWLVEVEAPSAPPADTHPHENGHAGGQGDPTADGQALTEIVALLRDERVRLWDELEARRREVAELHVLLQQARDGRVQIPPSQAGYAAPPHADRRPQPWWRRVWLALVSAP